jgi:dTDP-L-rhamnose 4-epimerase
MKILVTGGGGFIGTHLVSKISIDFPNADIFILDNFLEQVHGRNSNRKVQGAKHVVVGDVCDKILIEDIIEDFQPTHVYHLAAETGTGISLSNINLYAKTNIMGTVNLIEALSNKAKSLKKIILTSSRAVYGDGPWKSISNGRTYYPHGRTKEMLMDKIWDYPDMIPIGSDANSTVPHPCSIYGSTKLTQEHLISAWAISNSIEFYCFRLQNVYGPGQSPINSYTGITTHFINRALKKEPIEVFEDGNITRDFIYISDVIKVLILPLLSKSNGVVDVGTGHRVTIHEIATIINRICQGREIEISGNYRLGDVRFAALSDDYDFEIISGVKPNKIENGIEQLLKWMQNQKQFQKL